MMRFNRKELFIVFFVLYPFTFLVSQDSLPLPRFEIRVKGGEMIESFTQMDPAGKLSRSPITHPFFGLGFVYGLEKKERLGLHYERLSLGRIAFFAGSGYQAFLTAPNFNEFSLMYERDLFGIGRRKEVVFSLSAGTAFTFTGYPDATGTDEAWMLNATNDTIYSIKDTNHLKVGSFISVKVAGHVHYQLSHRFNLSASISHSRNVSANAVSVHEVSYRHPDLVNRQQARIETRGHISAFSITLACRFGQRKE